MQISVLGGGAFGTALAKMMDDRGHEVTLWCRGGAAGDQLLATRESSHLPGVKLSERVHITHDLDAAVAGRALLVGVTPSHVIRELLGSVAGRLSPGAVMVNASKGIEQGTLATVDEIYRSILPGPIADRAVFLSGPTFAKELAQGLPAAIVAASRDPAAAALVQDQLASERLRVYTSDDVTGVEVGGALKNIIAIAAGIADGLGHGHNTRAMIITRGLAEITRIGVKLGAHPLTFSGLAGLGDLVLTCTGDLSRNRQVGLELGRGKTLAEILAATTSVAEGVKTTRAAHELALRVGVELPITSAINAVLDGALTPGEAVSGLMRREPKAER
jgi:glycerol-3-phosphate dehydrogenase (NAD(P)+)